MPHYPSIHYCDIPDKTYYACWPAYQQTNSVVFRKTANYAACDETSGSKPAACHPLDNCETDNKVNMKARCDAMGFSNYKVVKKGDTYMCSK